MPRLFTRLASSGKTYEGATGEAGWGYHWPVMIAVIVASVLNWWIGHVIFSYISICGLEWLDNVGTYLWALWWVFAFATWGFWPFNKIKGFWARGISIIAVSWILGVLNWWLASFITNLQVYGFPILANLFFWIVLTDFSYTLWADQPAPKKAALDLITWYSATVGSMMVLPQPGQIPAWWFVPTQWLLGTGIWAYWSKKMTKGEAFVSFWVLNVFLVLLAIAIGVATGHYIFDIANAYASLIGGYSLYFLLWFAAGCSFTWSVFVIFEGWPWRKIKPPTIGAIIGLIGVLIIHIVTILISVGITRVIFPPTGPEDVYYLLQAFALAYAGVNWGFAIPMAFPSKRTGFPPTWSWEK